MLIRADNGHHFAAITNIDGFVIFKRRGLPYPAAQIHSPMTSLCQCNGPRFDHARASTSIVSRVVVRLAAD
jgi:hypothetical protein